MVKITDIKTQNRNKERVSIFLDGEFAFGLAIDAAAELRVGDELQPEDIERLQDTDEVARAKQSAIRYLARRPRSIAEVERNLQGKSFPEPVVAQVVAYLEARNYVDDESFARFWVEQRETFRPRSRYALRQELFVKGVPAAVVDRVLDDFDDEQAAKRAALKRASRWSDLPLDEFKEKLGGYLQRRGFRYDTCRAAIDVAWRHLKDNDTRTERS
jgi:regulatory protein